MNLVASLLSLVFITGSVVSTNPTLDQLCMNPAYAHSHDCSTAVSPPYYNHGNH